MSAFDPRLTDFRNFLYLVWKHLTLPDPTPVQFDIAQFIQNGPRRRGVMAFRGVGKSFVAGAYCAHKLLLDPQKKILVVSASKDRADAFSIFVKRLITEMPELQHLQPQEGQRQSNLAFDVGPATNDQSPSVKSVGITGQITGSRADLIIPDDCESLNNSATHDQRQKLSERVREFDAVLKPDGEVLYLGTPQTEFSIYNDLPARGYEFRIWPARFPDAKRRISYGEKLATFISERLDDGRGIVGRSTDPLRFSDLDLAEREGADGKSWFALQYMLDTSLSDQERYPLKLSDLTVMALDKDVGPQKVLWAGDPRYTFEDLPNVGLKGDRFYRPMDVLTPWAPYTGSVMFIDPSGRGKDETGFAVVKTLNGLLYCTEASGLQGGYDPETLRALALVAHRNKVNHILIEDNFGDGMYAALFQPVVSKVWPVTCEGVHSKGQKELRIIDTLEPVLNQHRLIMDERVVRNDYRGEGTDVKKTLFFQLSRLTRDKGALGHDDRIEALAGAVRYWLDTLSRDVDSAVQSARDSALDQQLRDFADGLDLTSQLYGDVRAPGAKEKTWVTQPTKYEANFPGTRLSR